MTTILDSSQIDRIRNDIKASLELNDIDIPDEIKVSTMTLEAKLNVMFYPWNIYRYIRKSSDSIVDIAKENRNKKKKKHEFDDDALMSDMEDDRKIVSHKEAERANIARGRKKQKISKNKQSDVFLNQVTVAIKVSGKDKPVSVKIFNNGTLHFTGCICVDNLLEAAYKLCIECMREVAVLNKEGKVVDVKFVDDVNKLKVENLYDFKVDMINCIFVVPFKIDRPKLQVLLKADQYNATYDSNGHAGVKIKYVSTGKKITIFVFESGSIIIILGKQGFSRINEIYTFIYRYLLDNYDSIVRHDNLTMSSIEKYMEETKEAKKTKKELNLMNIDEIENAYNRYNKDDILTKDRKKIKVEGDRAHETLVKSKRSTSPPINNKKTIKKELML